VKDFYHKTRSPANARVNWNEQTTYIQRWYSHWLSLSFTICETRKWRRLTGWKCTFFLPSLCI